ncbi:MAG TPA: hypothetical protein GX696_01235 [Pseudomonadaceae bacterium]|nr:hypothetical protein [Pseudomonadaceae bacterium]
MRHTFSIGIFASCLAASGMSIAQELPQAVADLGLEDVQIREKQRAEYGSRVRGTLPSGARIEIDLDQDGMIEDIEARGNDLFPVADIQSLIATTITENSMWPADAQLEEIEFERDGIVDIEGRLANGNEFDASFAADGRLLDFDTDD